MPLRTDFFNRPSFAKTREPKKRNRPHEASSSSPLTEPPSSSIVDLTESNRTGEKDPGPDPTYSQSPSPTPLQNSTENFLSTNEAPLSSPNEASPSSPNEAPSPSRNEAPLSSLNEAPRPLLNEASLSSLNEAPQPSLNEAPLSSLNESFPSSQRIIKGGKEVVISSDGEDTDSDGTFDGEDPALKYVPLFKPREPPVVSASKPISIIPKKSKFSLDSLVSQAVEDQKAEAKVAQLKAKLNNPLSKSDGRRGSDKKNDLHEDMLTSVLEDKDDDDDGRGAQRVIDAVRRTEALDHDKTWHFLDQTRTVAAVPEFPKNLFPPSSYFGVLREAESRERAFQSGMLEFAAARECLSDEFILWLFRSIPLEPKEELRQAYQRVIVQTKPARIATLIQPGDIDNLFLQLGAKPQALDLSKSIEEDTPDHTHGESSLKDRAILLCIFALLRDIAALVTIKTVQHAIQILLRVTLDTSLMGDDMVRSGLQSCLTALLVNARKCNAEETEQTICTTVYDTIGDVQFQARIIEHILPTEKWISLLRCRLAMAFLLRRRDPLTEPVHDVLDLKRLTVLLIRDERFQVKSFRGHTEYRYGDLIAISILLDVVINSSLIDLQDRDRDTDNEFNATVDKLCVQIKRIFSSIEDGGASHLKRMLAKQALEAVHYRVVYSVRTRPPPMRTTFKNESKPKKRDGNVKELFKKASDNTRTGKNEKSTENKAPAEDTTPATEDFETATEGVSESAAMEKGGDTSMPLRPQRSSSQRSS